MATKKPTTSTKLAPVPDRDILSFVEEAMSIYGKEVNEDRSVPDYRDGLKPVQRRILWAMHQLPQDRLVKTARVVGDTIGKYHPHGDASVFEAIVNGANQPISAIYGEGNWGTLVDGAAAMRYTNVKLSQYGRLFFGKHYLPVSTIVPNFDNSDKEPLILPALLPNLLFNGVPVGIGVGMATKIPAFVPETVLRMMVRILNNEDLGPADFTKGLKFYHQYGGAPVNSAANRKAITEFFGNTKGSVQWESPLEVNEAAKTITISRFAPGIKPTDLIEKVKTFPEVRTAAGDKGLSYLISARRDLNMNEFGKLVEKVKRLVSTKISYEIYVTERLMVKREVEEGVVKEQREVKFHTLSVPDLMAKWLKWRVKLEVQSLKWRIVQTEKDIAYYELLIFACDKLDIIFKGLRQPDPAAYLVKALKLTLEQVNTILDLKVRQLSKLDQDKLNVKLKEAKAHLKDLKLKLKDPVAEVRKFLEYCAGMFEQHSRWAGTEQYYLKTPTKGKTQSQEDGNDQSDDSAE